MNKKWFVSLIITLYCSLLVLSIIVIITDPWLHYRKPNNGTLVRLVNNERYQNDGLSRWYEYDALITGTSMSENFYTSQFDQLFGKRSIKLTFSGGTIKEISDSIDRTIMKNPDVEMVLCSLDGSMLLVDKDAYRWSNNLDYLYNDNIFDDVNYVLNISTFLEGVVPNVIIPTLRREKYVFSFDDYMNWNGRSAFGKKAVLGDSQIPQKSEQIYHLTYEDRKLIYLNIEQNIKNLARKYPNVEFVYFYPPYSIAYWDDLYRNGKVFWEVEVQEYVIELLLNESNIDVYFWDDDFENITNLNNYSDKGHYGENINSQMLDWINNKKGKMTKENSKEYIKRIAKFYSEYDYDSIYMK